MSITLTIPAELTLEEIEEKVTTLYYMQRVNYEAANEVAMKALPLWERIPRGRTRLREVAAKPPSGPNRGLYDRQHAEITKATDSFMRTAALSVFLEPGQWPEFDTDDDKSDVIAVWTELIGLSDEAGAIQTTIHDTGKQIGALLYPRERQAQDLRGWYVSVRTSRRGTTGWVVGGRGQSLHVVQDRLATVQQMLNSPQAFRGPVTGFSAIRTAAPFVSSPTTNPAEVEKYNLKSATIQLILPPDMAQERKEWVDRVLFIGATHHEAAKANWLAYTDWKTKADPITMRQKAAADWAEALPEDFHKAWVEGDALRWIKGAKEAFDILFSLAPLDSGDLREAVKAAHTLANPELVVTEAEAAFAANPPPNGASSFDVSLARTVKAAVGTADLAPMF